MRRLDYEHFSKWAASKTRIEAIATELELMAGTLHMLKMDLEKGED
jgi:hypothetical protein